MATSIYEAFRKAKAILSGVKFSNEILVNGSIIQFDTDKLEAGTSVFMTDGSGDFSILPNGDYLTKTQINFTVTEGIISSVKGLSNVQPVDTNQPQKQAQAKIDTTSGEDDNPGANDGKPTAVKKDSTAGKGAIDLDKAKKKKLLPSGTTKHSEDEGEQEDMSQINPPGGGADPSLVDPNEIAADSDYSTCMSKLNELHAQHGFLQASHDKLREEHDATNAKLNELIPKHNAMAIKCDDMASALKKATDDKLVMARQIETLSRTPSSGAIEEVKTNFKKADPEISESKIFKILTSNK